MNGTLRFALLLLGTVFILLSYVCSYIALSRRVMTGAMKMTRVTNDDSSIGEWDSFCREKRDAFGSARLRPFARSGVVIPEWAEDTRECDDFRADRVRECVLEDGYAACFECIESRSSLRVCAHIGEPVTIYDEIHRSNVTLWPNSSAGTGYCLREALAAQLSELNDANESSADSGVARARRECSARNADWILIRKRATGDAADSSFNFACRCKYPHLMTNIAGPMSSCSRAIGCNGHGRLDEASRSSSVDPFVNGRCECEDGWISEYSDQAGLGPYCREATVAEWPSLLLNDDDDDDDGVKDGFRTLDLYSPFVDRAFRSALVRQRVDRNETVRLRDPCYPCPIVQTDDGEAYFCGDEFVVEHRDGRPHLIEARVGVRGDRDYLLGNGGRFPNACLTVTSSDGLWHDRLLVQFMTQEWSKTKFSMEIGLLVSWGRIDEWLGGFSFESSRNYGAFVSKLKRPNTVDLNGRGVLWTFSHPSISNHRQRVCESLRSFLGGPKHTDVAYEADEFRVPFPFYRNELVINYYYYFPAGTPLNVDDYGRRLDRYRRLEAYKCPDLRGLDQIRMSENARIETDKETAHRIARSLLPICLIDHTDSTNGEKYTRPDVNCNNSNDTACVVFRNDGMAVYLELLWCPFDMKMLRFCGERSASVVDYTCSDEKCGTEEETKHRDEEK